MISYDHYRQLAAQCELLKANAEKQDEVIRTLEAAREINETALLPVERMALNVALDQVLRGEQPAIGGAMTCVLALARIVGKHDWLATLTGGGGK